MVMISIRVATAADADRLRTLSQLDSGRVPTGDVLIGEVATVR